VEIYLVGKSGSAIGAFLGDELPARELLERAALLLSGTLLLIPGCLTDAAAFVLLWLTNLRLTWQSLRPRVRVVARGNPRCAGILEDNICSGHIVEG
jgi:UPF0716 family protein affecting phage T7 exclusion